MKTTRSRKDDWPRKITIGRVTVTIYRRNTPNGGPGFMVANYANGKRRFDSYPTEAEAIEEATKLARKLSERDVLGASMTKEQTVDYAAAVQALKPFNIPLTAAVSTLAEAVKLVGDLPGVLAAAKSYTVRHRQVTVKRVPEVVAELLKIKESRGASARYIGDLRFRLGQFCESFQCNIGNVTSTAVQEWLDSKKTATQSYMNFRRVLHLLFEFAVARSYASDNPIPAVERVKVRNGAVQIFTPVEVARLLAAASPGFQPCIALGAFAGLRSAEIERLTWQDIDLASRNIVIGADAAKTASRRIVPIADNLSEWLRPYSGRQGMVWRGTHDEFYDAQQESAAATEVRADEGKHNKAQKPVEWKTNALRHSYASYRFAQIGDAGRVAGELGNSAAVVHRHYRELVKPADAEKWFRITPERETHIIRLSAATKV